MLFKNLFSKYIRAYLEKLLKVLIQSFYKIDIFSLKAQIGHKPIKNILDNVEKTHYDFNSAYNKLLSTTFR